MYSCLHSGYFLPLGKWTREEIKHFEGEKELTNTEVDNESILETCSPALEKVFTEYYEKVGKRGYKFILSEEIGKVSRMSEEDFSEFVKVMGGNIVDIMNSITAQQK
jgi:predicted peroxiredoxin